MNWTVLLFTLLIILFPGYAFLLAMCVYMGKITGIRIMMREKQPKEVTRIEKEQKAR